MRDLLIRSKAKFLALDRSMQIVAISLLLVTMCALFFDFHGRDKNAGGGSASSEDDSSLDTFIPDGFSLVPIEIANSSGMDSILGRYGTADLFKEGQKTPFMKNVRLVRGIEADGPWAALVPSDFATSLLEAGGRFFVAVKGKVSSSTQFQPKITTRKRSITYGGE